MFNMIKVNKEVEKELKRECKQKTGLAMKYMHIVTYDEEFIYFEYRKGTDRNNWLGYRIGR